jgi:hypothetical protein
MDNLPEPNGYGRDYFGEAARVAARDLLWEHLTPEQREEYRRGGVFTAKGNDTGREYLISVGWILYAPKSYDRIDFCLHVGDQGGESIPYEDILLAKKLLIECDEDLFLKTANANGHHPLRRSDGRDRVLR